MVWNVPADDEPRTLQRNPTLTPVQWEPVPIVPCSVRHRQPQHPAGPPPPLHWHLRVLSCAHAACLTSASWYADVLGMVIHFVYRPAPASPVLKWTMPWPSGTTSLSTTTYERSAVGGEVSAASTGHRKAFGRGCTMTQRYRRQRNMRVRVCGLTRAVKRGKLHARKAVEARPIVGTTSHHRAHAHRRRGRAPRRRQRRLRRRVAARMRRAGARRPAGVGRLEERGVREAVVATAECDDFSMRRSRVPPPTHALVRGVGVVQRRMHANDDPRRDGAVDRGEVALQPRLRGWWHGSDGLRYCLEPRGSHTSSRSPTHCHARVGTKAARVEGREGDDVQWADLGQWQRHGSGAEPCEATEWRCALTEAVADVDQPRHAAGPARALSHTAYHAIPTVIASSASSLLMSCHSA